MFQEEITTAPLTKCELTKLNIQQKRKIKCVTDDRQLSKSGGP